MVCKALNTLICEVIKKDIDNWIDLNLFQLAAKISWKLMAKQLAVKKG